MKYVTFNDTVKDCIWRGLAERMIITGHTLNLEISSKIKSGSLRNCVVVSGLVGWWVSAFLK